MQLTIHLPDRETTLASVRTHWASVVDDPVWRKVDGKFETNAMGQVIVTPPPPFFHNDRAYRISRTIETLLGGHGRTECPLVTIDGTKVPDAVWFSDTRYQQVVGAVVCEVCPEICVEVRSPSNTDAEMRHKRFLYFDAGAIECWVCDLDGHMTYYQNQNATDPHLQSQLCPNFPDQIED